MNDKEKYVLRLLYGIAIGLIAFHTLYSYMGGAQISYQIYRLFHLGYEGNIPTWFSSIILFLCGMYSLEIYFQIKKETKNYSLWLIMAFLFIAMSCDEVAQIHEMLGAVINKYYLHLSNTQHSEWVFILGPFALIPILYIVVYLRKNNLEKRVKTLLISGFGLYVLGAFVLEATLNFVDKAKYHWLWRVENIFEESFEIFGTLMILTGLIIYKRIIHEGLEKKEESYV